MININAIFLAARTERSKAYAQAMEANGIIVEKSVCFGSSSPALGKKHDQNGLNYVSCPDLLLPDLNIHLDTTLNNISKKITCLDVHNINASRIISEVSSFTYDLIIYSGFGKQIVKSELLDLGIPVLHIHSGTLPEYRGSTTIYYELLESNRCGVTGIFLNEKIDEGVIVGKSSYPKPPINCDIDYVYDSAIRADLLIKILKNFSKSKICVQPQTVSKSQFNEYYVIHPLLKHLAILSLNDNR